MYRINVYGSDFDYRLVEIMIARLPYEPMSLYRAKAAEDDLFVGWDRGSDLLATVIDAVRENTLVVGELFSKSPSRRGVDPFPRPGRNTPSVEKPKKADSEADGIEAMLGTLGEMLD